MHLRPGSALGNSFRQGGAFDELENQGLGLACFFNAVNLPDVGMIQGGQNLRFSLKPGHSLAVRSKLFRQDLERHIPVQLGIGSAINFSHTAFTDLLQNLVMRDGLAEHDIPLDAVQLRSMLRLADVEGNGKPLWLGILFPLASRRHGGCR